MRPSKTQTTRVSMIVMHLPYIETFSKFENKMKATALLKYDKDSITVAYLLAATLRRLM